MQQVLLRVLVNVHRRQPRAGIGGGGQRRAEQAVDILLQAVYQGPGFITNDGHTALLL
jgi:hypothetical protein